MMPLWTTNNYYSWSSRYEYPKPTCELVFLSWPVRMAVEVRGRSMGGPPRVGDANMLVDTLIKVDILALLEDFLLQQLDLASALDKNGRWVRKRAVNPNTRWVIAAVLQTFEASNQNVKYFFSTFWSKMIQIRKNATHNECWVQGVFHKTSNTIVIQVFSIIAMIACN